jgi:hypothetical protein
MTIAFKPEKLSSIPALLSLYNQLYSTDYK